MKRVTIAKAFAITVATTLALGIASKAQAADKECSNTTLKGTFAFFSTGFITAPPPEAGPFAIVGTQTFDGNGTTAAAARVSQNGNIIPVTLAGTYSVNPDCTGTFTVQISPVGITTHLFFVIADNGREFQLIQTDPGVVVSGAGRKQ